MLMALGCVCSRHVVLLGQTLSRRADCDSECVHTEAETGFRFRASALILLHAFPPVFLSHSLFFLFLSVIIVILAAEKKPPTLLAGSVKKKKKTMEEGRGSTTELRWAGWRWRWGAIRPPGWV